jgi:putative transcriptional regulator
MSPAKCKPQILVAMPSLKDGYFDKSVILLCEYHENGAMGFVINSPSTTSVDDLLRELGLKARTPQNQMILIGGPVQPELCWVVHTPDFVGKSTTRLGDDLCLSAAQEVLTSITEGIAPRDYILGVGYAGWAAGQLDREIEQEAWWLSDMDLMPILEQPYDARWEMVMKKLGLSTSYATFCRA